MLSESSDWKEASFSDEIYLKDVKHNKKENNAIIYNLLFNILHLVKNIRDLDISNICIEKLNLEPVNVNKFAIIKSYIDELVIDDNLRHILMFKLLIENQIATRLICSLSADGLTIVEVQTDLEIIKCNKKYSNIVFSLDCMFEIENLSVIYRKDLKLYKLFETVICDIKTSLLAHYTRNEIVKDLGIDALPKNDCFIEDNKKKLTSNPKSIQMFKKHPLYVLESILTDAQCIHPKRPIEGYFKGEPIYPRKNIVKLKTERQLYIIGKTIKSNKPYRKILKNEECKLLYAPWQTEDIVIDDFKDTRYMDYFHANHIPTNCIYIDHENAAILAAKLKIKYKECVVGFRRKQIVVKGIFVEKSNEAFFRHALFEEIQNNEIADYNSKFENCLTIWKKLARKVRKYKEIIERVG